jgi:hypothetical protein
VSGIGVRFVVLAIKPIPVVQRKDPRCLRSDLVAVTLRLQNPRQLYSIGKRSTEPICRYPFAGLVESETPFAGKIDHVALLCWDRRNSKRGK